MKISPLSEAFRFLNRVREKQDGQGHGNGGNSSQQGKQEHKNSEDHPSFEASLEKVGAEIEAFQTDAQAQSNGLNASMVGSGPGLRVVLKDGSGAVVRQLTGEEFLRLRAATAGDVPVRGKILDQKL